jgi:hypothetical protein
MHLEVAFQGSDSIRDCMRIREKQKETNIQEHPETENADHEA